MSENANKLDPKLERGMKLAHRSPTYALTLPDGRALHVRREAQAFRDDGMNDHKVLAAGGGHVIWWVRCDGAETYDESLPAALHRVVCRPVAADDADGNWEQVKALFSAAMGLLDLIVPTEQQAVLA